MEEQWVWRPRVLLVLRKKDSLLEIAGTSTSIILFSIILYSDSALPLLFSAILRRSGIVYTRLFSLLYHGCPHAHHPPAWMLLTGLEEDGMNLLSGCFAKILGIACIIVSAVLLCARS